jgi:ABC-2 type transport system permease protein
MLKILLKKQLYELNSSFFYDRKKGKARAKSTSILFIVLYALLMIVVIGGMFADVFHAVQALCRSGT